MIRCPGQDQRFWRPEDVSEARCPQCGKDIEFFKDEPKLKCRDCGHFVINPKIDLGCAQWCQYADQCLAVSIAKDASSMRKKLIDDMKNVFAGDEDHVEHALAVLKFAEQIQDVEGGDPLVVKAAAILHDVELHEAEGKFDSSTAKCQEIGHRQIAKDILQKYGLEPEIVEHICSIITSDHGASDVDTLESRILWDADWLASVPETLAGKRGRELKNIISATLKTRKGRDIATALSANKQTKEAKYKANRKGG